MAKKEGLVAAPSLRDHPADAPSPLRSVKLRSHPFHASRVICSTASIGGEGGIRTPGTVSGTTDFESVPFGHSGTSPVKYLVKKNFIGQSKPGLLQQINQASCSRYSDAQLHNNGDGRGLCARVLRAAEKSRMA